MPNILAQHRIIGIRYVLREMKDAGLVEEESLYPSDAISNVQDELTKKALTWYEVGARRGALEILDAILDGKLTVECDSNGAKEIIAATKAITWKKRLNVTTGASKTSIPSRTYTLKIEDLGFE